jgi:uncharacterized protein (TIGR02118 family)
MYKVVWFARFPQGMAKDEARRYWAEHHAPLSLRSGIERYVQNHVSGPPPTVGGVAVEETHFDGYSLGWWSDREAYDATMASPEWKAVEADGVNVFDMTWLEGMSAQVREHVVIDGPQSPFKVVWVCRLQPGMDPAAGHAHWENVHGPIFKSLDIDRYVQNHVVGPLPGGDEPGFDGFSECWFRDREQFVAALDSDGWAEATADGHNFLDYSQLWGAVLDERIVREGDREFAQASS